MLDEDGEDLEKKMQFESKNKTTITTSPSFGQKSLNLLVHILK